MKKIGLIDYFLDEAHAYIYPDSIKKTSNGELVIAYAYGEIDNPNPGRKTNDEYFREHPDIIRCNSIEEIVEKSDCLLIASPDNCEQHERLCQIPLRSGKPTYIDKTFAPDKATAERIFAIAEEYGTPCFSSSALRYATEYENIDTSKITAICTFGPVGYEIYAIHQLEPVMMLMKAMPDRVMRMDTDKWTGMVVHFEDGRYATIACYETDSPFITNICCTDQSKCLTIESDYFTRCTEDLCRFYLTGEAKVPHEDTIAIMAALGAGRKAAATPGVWVDVE